MQIKSSCGKWIHSRRFCNHYFTVYDNNFQNLNSRFQGVNLFKGPSYWKEQYSKRNHQIDSIFFGCFHHFLWRNCYKGNPQKFIENKLIKNEWKTLIGERTSWNTIPWNFKKIFSTKGSFQCYPPGHRTQIEHKEDVPQTFQTYSNFLMYVQIYVLCPRGRYSRAVYCWGNLISFSFSMDECLQPFVTRAKHQK